MRTIRQSFARCAFSLALSMSALPNLVNAQAQSLTSVNKNNSSKPDLKDSVREPRKDIAGLISAVMQKGTNANIGSNLAPVIGLPRAMPTMDVEILIRQKDKNVEKRACFVVYEPIQGTPTGASGKRPVCAYFVRIKRSRLDTQTQYFRVDLNGNLEKVILSQGKLKESGKVVRGSGVKTDLDADSQEVRKTFEAEMNFWLKDWLKKQQKSAAKKTADSAVKKPSTTAL